MVLGSRLRPTWVTSPAGRPRNVTGAPTDSPSNDSVKVSAYTRATDSGCFIAVDRSA